jgi:hypothetical protein
MSDELYGKVEIQRSEDDSTVTIVLDGQMGNLNVGEPDIFLPPSGFPIGYPVTISGGTATIAVGHKIFLQGDSGEIFLQAPNRSGDLQNRIRLDPKGANLWMGGNEQDGDVCLFSTNSVDLTNDNVVNQATIHLNGESGDIFLRDKDDSGAWRDRIRFVPKGANCWIGGNDQPGNILLFNSNVKGGYGDSITSNQATIRLNGESGDIFLRAKDSSDTWRDRIRFVPKGANCWIGGNERPGNILLFNSNVKGEYGDSITSDQASIWLNAENGNLALGGNGRDGDILLFPADETISTTAPSRASIHLNGEEGDIILRNADCAEEFDIAVAAEVEPGTVMVIDDEGKLRPSTDAYDKRVAGVISGAGDYKPGLVLDRQVSSEKRLPIALMGKAYCKVDAQYAPIEVGDLLTTSPNPGHAMKAADPAKAFGTVIGKALKPLKEGEGLIPILIALQ